MIDTASLKVMRTIAAGDGPWGVTIARQSDAAMTYFVEKRLFLGSIRFGAGRRHAIDTIDGNKELSTGAHGEFIRRRNEGFYFGGHDRFDAPTLPPSASVRNTPFWTSLSRHRGLVGLAIAGAILVLLGFLVMANKGAQGLIEVIFGLAIIAIPVFITAQERKKLIDQEEHARAEREAAENRKREMLSGYTAALERVQNDRGEEPLQQLVNEHPDLPYNLWSPSARRIVLLIGFDELGKRGVERANEVARIMDGVSRAAGLTPEHEYDAKMELYNAVLWHLLADDRLGVAQQEQLRLLREGLGVSEADLPEDTAKSIDQFERLRGVTTANLPRAQCSHQLGFKEYCIHQSQSDLGLLHITNKQLIVEGKKTQAHSMPSIADLNVVVDDNLVLLRDGATRKDLRFRVGDPLYTAAMIDLASSIDDRPRGFA